MFASNPLIFAAIVLLLFTIVIAHEQIGLKVGDAECMNNPPPFQSYHIHILFWQNNANSTAAAEQLQLDFIKEFGLTEKDTCKFEPGETMPHAGLCVFETDYAPAGPFVTAQTGWFIPVSEYERAMGWTMKNKGKLDMLAHPNSGCGLQDHTQYGVWGGNPWELDASIFFD